MNKEEFINYLEDTLIPDLIESGHECTAEDFRACIAFMRGAEEVTFDKESGNELHGNG
jgi:hypothetical protein